MTLSVAAAESGGNWNLWQKWAINIVKKNAQTAHTRLCYFQAFCAIFATGHASTVFFAFCCQNWPIRWMSRHIVSLRVVQTCFLMVFYAIMRLILNDCFCAIFLRELSVCASFYAFSGYVVFPTMCAKKKQKYCHCFVYCKVKLRRMAKWAQSCHRFQFSTKVENGNHGGIGKRTYQSKYDII